MKILIGRLLGFLVLFSACKTGPKGQVFHPPSSRYTVNWPGEYLGMIPCDDCDGVETIINLYKNQTYTIKTRPLGKSTDFEVKRGKIQWDNKGNIVYLEGGAPGGYRVGDHKIIQLDIQGNPIMGNLAAKYILLQRTPGILERYWKLVEIRGKQVTKTEGMKREPYLILREEQHKIAFQGGCNLYTGTYSLKGKHRIRVGKLSGTLLNCADMSVEQQLLQIIRHGHQFSVGKDTLLLTKGRKETLARFQAVYFE